MGCRLGIWRFLEESMTKQIDAQLLKEIRQRYNEESIYLLSDFPKKDVNAISTGSILLDDAIGVGGVPRGRITELYGPDSSGKTTLCQHIIASAHKQNELAAFIDVEHAMDPSYAERCGVDFSKLYISQPNFAEEALGIADALIRDGNVAVVIIDSIAALSPEIEREEEFGDVNTTGMIRAKLLGTFFRRTKNYLRQNDIALVVTNQMRDNTKSRFFGGLKTTGGHSVKHYASVRISLWRSDYIKERGEEIGLTIEATVKKNKVARPFKKATFKILKDYGIDNAANLLAVGMDLNLVRKSGSWYNFEGETLGQGEVNTIQTLREDPEIAGKLERLCWEILDSEV